LLSNFHTSLISIASLWVAAKSYFHLLYLFAFICDALKPFDLQRKIVKIIRKVYIIMFILIFHEIGMKSLSKFDDN